MEYPGVDFNAAEFVAGISLAMTMGTPNPEEERPLFFFPADVSNVSPADDEDVPFDPNARPVVDEPPSETALCAVEYEDHRGQPVEFGVIDPSVAKLTFLADEHAKIKGFEYVMLGGQRFDYVKTEIPLAMFDVNVYQVHVRAVDNN